MHPTRFLWKLALKIAGWKTNLVFPYHHLPKFIVIVGPHTSNWDFIVGVAYRSILKMESTRFLGKKELFRPPLGFLFRMLGGYPVDRSSSRHMVDEVVKIFHAHEKFSIALSPEGTRKKVEKLRTGFYHIARQASVPIIMVGLDYANRTVIFSKALYAGEQATDFDKILAFFRPIKGKHPEVGMKHL